MLFPCLTLYCVRFRIQKPDLLQYWSQILILWKHCEACSYSSTLTVKYSCQIQRGYRTKAQSATSTALYMHLPYIPVPAQYRHQCRICVMEELKHINIYSWPRYKLPVLLSPCSQVSYKQSCRAPGCCQSLTNAVIRGKLCSCYCSWQHGRWQTYGGPSHFHSSV